MAYTRFQHNEDGPLLSPSESNTNASDEDDNNNDREQVAGLLSKRDEPYLAYVISMAFGTLLIAMNGIIIVASYAAIGSELNQLQNASWIPTAYMMTQTSFQPLAGKLSDIFGRKACLLTCYAIYALGSLIFGLSTTMTQLIVARAISGIGSGGITILVTIIMSDIVSLRTRGTWQGVLNVVSAIGSLIGALLGGFFADTIGWRWPFLMQVPLFALAFFVVLLARLPATKGSRPSENIKRIDFGGAITLVSTIFFLLFGLDRGGNTSWSDWRTIILLTACATFASLFVFIETSVASEPFAPVRIVSNRSLLPCYVTGFFAAGAASTLFFYAPLFYQAAEGMTASEASAWLIFGVIGGLVGSLAGGLIMQRTGKYYDLTVISHFFVLVGTGITFISSGVIVVSTIGIAIGMGVVELGIGGGVVTTLIALIAHAGQADQAAATAVSYLLRSLGSVLCLAVSGALFQNTLRYLLHKRLSGENVPEIVKRVRQSLSYLNRLDPATKAIVVQSYQDAVKAIFLFTAAMAALAALSSLFIKEKALTRARS